MRQVVRVSFQVLLSQEPPPVSPLPHPHPVLHLPVIINTSVMFFWKFDIKPSHNANKASHNDDIYVLNPSSGNRHNPLSAVERK